MPRKSEKKVERYKSFCTGENITYADQMPLLIAEGRVPISVSQVLERGIDSSFTWLNCISTGDATVYDENMDYFKIVVGAGFLRSVTPETRTLDGAILLPSYKEIEGAEFRVEEVRKLLWKGLDKERAKKHPIWNALVPQDILHEYVDRIFSEAEGLSHILKYGYGMDVNLCPCPRGEGITVAKPFKLMFDSSSINGWSNVDGRSDLVGIRE